MLATILLPIAAIHGRNQMSPWDQMERLEGRLIGRSPRRSGGGLLRRSGRQRTRHLPDYCTDRDDAAG